jgi:hypothetical protein
LAAPRRPCAFSLLKDGATLVRLQLDAETTAVVVTAGLVELPGETVEAGAADQEGDQGGGGRTAPSAFLRGLSYPLPLAFPRDVLEATYRRRAWLIGGGRVCHWHARP